MIKKICIDIHDSFFIENIFYKSQKKRIDILYFYIDESGHTGNNLFDAEQPSLYYGVLSSKFNINEIGEKYIPNLRKKLGVERLHAAELGNGGLVSIAKDLASIQSRLGLQFIFCSVAKLDHAVISFFDQVFDQGLNPAVPWTSYWTPLRYVLLPRSVRNHQ